MRLKFKVLLLLLLLATPAYGAGVLDNYIQVDMDISGVTWYVGFTTAQGGWYIKAIDTTTADVYRVTYSYVSGETNYPTAWANRAVTAGVSAYRTYSDAF